MLSQLKNTMFCVAKICKRALRASTEGNLAVAASTPTSSSLVVGRVTRQVQRVGGGGLGFGGPVMVKGVCLTPNWALFVPRSFFSSLQHFGPAGQHLQGRHHWHIFGPSGGSRRVISLENQAGLRLQIVPNLAFLTLKSSSDGQKWRNLDQNTLYGWSPMIKFTFDHMCMDLLEFLGFQKGLYLLM